VQESALELFLGGLQRELAAGQVMLPSWSKVTERARAALSGPEVDYEALAQLLGAEAGLAVRVLTIANSSLFGRGGRPLSDLKLATLRIGADNLRSAVYAYALAQLREAPKLQRLRPTLQQLWRESVEVGALARLLGARTANLNPDTALLAGLLHNIGKVYILVRYDSGGAEWQTERAFVPLLSSWQARIGSAVAHNWRLHESICQALGAQELLEADASAAPLSATLAAAVIGASAAGDSTRSEQTAAHLATFARFGQSSAAWRELLERAHADSTALRVSFGD